MTELGIDPKTAMKNYISNEDLGIDTSSAYIRRELQLAIEQGRQRGQNGDSEYEAFRHLGAALHTLEGMYFTIHARGDAHTDADHQCARFFGTFKLCRALSTSAWKAAP